MNKFTPIITFFIFLTSPIFIYAQADKIDILKLNGEVVENGSELLSFAFGSAGKNLLTDSLIIKNTSNETLRIQVRKNEISVVDGTFNNFHALSQDVPASEYVTPNVWELGPNETLPREAYFLGKYFLQNQFGTSSFLYSFLTLDENEVVHDSVYVIYHFLNNSVTPLDNQDNVFVNREVLVTGDPNEEILFPVKLFNHNSDSVAIRIEKQILNLESGHDVYFSYGGDDYTSSDDFSSEEGYYISSMDTLYGELGFIAKFNAHGEDSNIELSKVNYRFFNINNEDDQSDITLLFNPSAVGFSEINEYDISAVYPNPTGDVFHINHHLPYSVNTIMKVYNSAGLLITSKEINNKDLISTFSIGNWETGIYYLSIEIDGKPIGTEKIIKK